MAKNYIQDDEILTLPAPYAVSSGGGALIGAIFGVALVTLANAETGAFAVEGVWELAKTSAQAWTVGAKIYWDNTNKLCTTTSTDNTPIGVAVAVAANPSGTGQVRLNGSF